MIICFSVAVVALWKNEPIKPLPIVNPILGGIYPEKRQKEFKLMSEVLNSPDGPAAPPLKY